MSIVLLVLLIFSATVQAAQINTEDYSFYSGDYNNDGLKDIILAPKPRVVTFGIPIMVAADLTGLPIVFQARSDGKFDTIHPAVASVISALTLEPLQYELYFADFNGDGVLDILFQSHTNNAQTFIVYADGSGSYAKTLSYLGYQGISKAAATVEIKDLQGDGISDIVFTLNGGSTKFAFGGSAFIQASDLQLNNVVPGAQVDPLFDGAFQVDESGAATYSFDIELPPVPSGMKPDFGINYSSSAGNGTLGVGWSITGESAITRCPTSYVEDGYVDGVDFDGNDQFCLDGIRLVLKAGVHGQDGAEYRLANDNAQRIFVRGTSAGGPQKFEVQSPKGAKTFYGETADSRFGTVAGNVAIWSLSSNQNVFGDIVSYSYNTNKSTGEHYLVNASYGQYQVVFNYEDRPDVSSGYIAPALKSVQKKRLKKILINRPDKTLVYYTFSFSNNADGQGANHSYLNAINVCISDTQCKLATRWHWTEFKSDNFRVVLDPMNKGMIDDWDDYSFTLGEWNHDGLTDVLWQERSAGYNNWFFATGDGGFNAAELLPRSQVDYGIMDGGDWNGDGLDDAMFFDPNSGNADWFINSRSSPKSFTPVRFFDAGLAKNKGLSYGEWNGDGLTDILVYQASTGNNTWLVNNGNLTFSATDLPIFPGVIDGKWWTTGDWNGDGIDDFFWYDKGDGRNRWYVNDTNWQAGATSLHFSLVDNPVAAADIAPGTSTSNIYFLFGDWNSDGFQDFMTVRKDTGQNTWFVNDGTVHFEKYTNIIQPSYLAGFTAFNFADWNGDGLLDLMVHAAISGSSRFFVGTGQLSFSPSVLAITPGEIDQTCTIRVGDFDANGTNDFMCYGSELGDNRWYYSQGERMAVIDRFMDPMGDETIINYELLNKTSAYTREYTDEAFVSTVTPAMKVVTKVTTDNGVGGQHVTKYKYAGYKVHTRGYGDLGFRKLESIDTTTGIRAITEYSQDYLGHTVGMVTRTESRYVKNGQDIKLNETINTNAVREIAYNGMTVRMPYLAHQEVSSWDLVTGELIGSVAADFTYDQYGNLLTNTTTTSDPVTGDVFSSVKSTQYYPVQESPYFVGLVKRIDSTSSGPGTPETGPLTMTRATSFEYNLDGTPKKQVVEPDNAKALTTSFEYNAKGQVTTTTTSAAGMTSRVATVVYDADGRESQQINALGHKTQFFYENLDYPWLRTKTLDPNLRPTVTTYDAWGRAPTITAADGTSITQITYWCDENCEEGEVYYSKTTPSVGKPSFVFFDKEGREVRKSAYGFDGTNEGRLVHVRTEYNAIGKIARHSEPHFDGEAPQWNQTWYDDLGRPQVAYDSSGNPMTYIHLGRTVMSTNALGQSKIVETNAQGQTVKVTDSIGKTIEYAYRPFGELSYTKDSLGNITRATFDIFGNKVSMQDPDKGSWTYEYDNFGQLLKQTDARGWVTYHEYDKLGRMTKRVDRYGTANAETSTWEYDLATLGASANKALGMLNKSAKGAFIETYEFDTLGRPTKTNTFIDAIAYTTATTYDSYSRPVTLAYPGTGLTIKNEYHPTLGMLQRVKNNSTGAEYWELQETNARGQASLIQLGNLMQTSRTFNEQTGYLESIISYVAGQGTNLQEMAFEFDAIGNLKERSDLVQNVSETLAYDDLNRLVSSHTTTPLQSYYDSVTYDDTGNIMTKSGVGTYTYGGTCNSIKAGPHAVTSIVGAVGEKNATYCYDQNGNMLSGDSRTLTYTAQDVPKKIVKGSNSVEFFYGPSQERYKRIDIENGVTTTTVNIGGYEKIKTGSDTITKYYLGGFAVITKKNSEALKTQYLLTDHQGSIVASVDPLGAVSERMAFDAWGKRRAVSWAPMSFTDLYAFKSTTTKRGYTGHEHVDSMGLIHMNGRVYDPVIGRFLSADPFVQDATNSQSLNRYSYVMNNPLSMTDPSGFFWKKLKNAFKKIARAVVKAVKAVVRAVAIVALGPIYATYKLQWNLAKRALQNKYIAAVAQIVGCALTTPAGCAVISGVISATAAYGATGDWGAALRAGVTAAATSYISAKAAGGIHTATDAIASTTKNVLIGKVFNTVAHGALAGAISRATGGSFKSGFIAGAAGAAVSNALSDGFNPGDGSTNWNANGKALGFAGRTAVSAIAGGLGAKWSGGDAAFGAFQAALGHLYNAEKTPENPGGLDPYSGDAASEQKGVYGADAIESTSALSTAISTPVGDMDILGGFSYNAFMQVIGVVEGMTRTMGLVTTTLGANEVITPTKGYDGSARAVSELAASTPALYFMDEKTIENIITLGGSKK